MKEKLYRNQYIICICDNNPLSLIRWQFESVTEFAEFLGVERNVAIQTLYHLFNKKTDHITIEQKRYLVEFIKESEEI